jgi:hypothetical protein
MPDPAFRMPWSDWRAWLLPGWMDTWSNQTATLRRSRSARILLATSSPSTLASLSLEGPSTSTGARAVAVHLDPQPRPGEAPRVASGRRSSVRAGRAHRAVPCTERSHRLLSSVLLHLGIEVGRVTVRRSLLGPARLIGHWVRVLLRASKLLLFEGRHEVARHERATARGSQTLNLDHYLEILIRKPGALPGATALIQARTSGVFTSAQRGLLGQRTQDPRRQWPTPGHWSR